MPALHDLPQGGHRPTSRNPASPESRGQCPPYATCRRSGTARHRGIRRHPKAAGSARPTRPAAGRAPPDITESGVTRKPRAVPALRDLPQVGHCPTSRNPASLESRGQCPPYATCRRSGTARHRGIRRHSKAAGSARPTRFAAGRAPPDIAESGVTRKPRAVPALRDLPQVGHCPTSRNPVPPKAARAVPALRDLPQVGHCPTSRNPASPESRGQCPPYATCRRSGTARHRGTRYPRKPRAMPALRDLPQVGHCPTSRNPASPESRGQCPPYATCRRSGTARQGVWAGATASVNASCGSLDAPPNRRPGFAEGPNPGSQALACRALPACGKRARMARRMPGRSRPPMLSTSSRLPCSR